MNDENHIKANIVFKEAVDKWKEERSLYMLELKLINNGKRAVCHVADKHGIHRS